MSKCNRPSGSTSKSSMPLARSSTSNQPQQPRTSPPTHASNPSTPSLPMRQVLAASTSQPQIHVTQPSPSPSSRPRPGSTNHGTLSADIIQGMSNDDALPLGVAVRSPTPSSTRASPPASRIPRPQLGRARPAGVSSVNAKDSVAGPPSISRPIPPVPSTPHLSRASRRSFYNPPTPRRPDQSNSRTEAPVLQPLWRWPLPCSRRRTHRPSPTHSRSASSECPSSSCVPPYPDNLCADNNSLPSVFVHPEPSTLKWTHSSS